MSRWKTAACSRCSASSRAQLPIIGYDSGGPVSYDDTTDAFSLNATPFESNSSTALGLFFSGSVNINIQVDGSGTLVGGVPGDDLVVTGDLDMDGDFNVDYSRYGPLLTGEMLAFGWEDSGLGGIDRPVRFPFLDHRRPAGGLFAGKDLGVYDHERELHVHRQF